MIKGINQKLIITILLVFFQTSTMIPTDYYKFLFWFLLNTKQSFLKENSIEKQTVLFKKESISENLPCVSSNQLKNFSSSEFNCSNLPFCPDNFTDAVNICYILTEPSTFPPSCPFQNVLPFQAYKDIIQTNGKPIWMPVKRDKTEGLGFLEWIEASSLYKSEFDQDFFVSGEIKNKDCLIYYNSSTKVLVSCDEEYSGVCAYYKLDQIPDQICNTIGMCYQSDFSSDSKCFCLGGSGQDQSEFRKAEYLKSYQNRVYGSLTTDLCSIGLEKYNNTYIWSYTQKEIDYQYWSPNANFEESYIYGASTTSGWVLTKELQLCFLYEKEIEFVEPFLNLSITTENKFLLKITNYEYLKRFDSLNYVYCFSTAGRMSLKYRYEVITKIDNATYEFEAHNSGPGYYWCEAVKYQNMETISSQKIFLNKNKNFANEFVTIFSIYYVEGTNPLCSQFIEFIERILSITITIDNSEKSSYDYTARVMKIIDLNETEFKALFNVHFTGTVAKIPNSLPLLSSRDEFERMKNLINETISKLQAIDLVMIDFLSASYCPEESTNLTWPRTEIGNVATSEEFCFANGIRVKRFCGGDFLDGGRWSEPEDCEKPIYSSVTEMLLNIFQDSTNPFGDIYEISKRYSEFQSFDVFLTALLYNNYWQNANIDYFVQTLDNIFQVNTKILEDSQDQMRAKDLILEVIDHVATIGNINSTKFATISESSTFGIILLEDGTIESITTNNVIQSIIDTTKNIEAAIWLNPGYTNNDKIIFKIFYDDIFFTSSNISFETNHKIFGIAKTESLISFQVLYKSDNQDENCAFWNYNLESFNGRGSWVVINKTDPSPYSSQSFILCEFNSEASAVTILSASNSQQNITKDLQDLLNSDENPTDIIIELSDISDRYDEFLTDDIYLIGQILYKICNDTNLDLVALAHIISNLHEVKRQILSDSQVKNLATDLVLHSIDEIVKNHNYQEPVNVTDNNFMIFITTLQHIDFTGLVIFNESQKLQTQNLTGNVNLDDITQNDNINSALYLPSKLKEQLGTAAKIIITIFQNDYLFNQKKIIAKSVNKIFGVVLPDVKQYAQPISIIHNIFNENLEKICAYWSYDSVENITGIWENEQEANDISSFSRCEFWHTTHFGLLLLDSDKYDSNALDWITKINCGLSMFGLCCIILTAILFKRWRTNSGNQILLNFVFASILQISIFYGSNNVNKNADDDFLCTIIGVVLHYSIVSQFCWMFVIAVLQFKRFVEVLRGPPKHVLLKACLCGWVLPCFPVACVYFLDEKTYINGNVGLCYPSGLSLYLGVWLPISIIVAINLIIFLFIIYNVVYRKTECSDVSSDEVMFQWRLAILLFFMLGLTWSFGFLSELDFGIVFVYIFCITATLQGFIMFLFFIVFNANTRYLYTQACKKTNKYY